MFSKHKPRKPIKLSKKRRIRVVRPKKYRARFRKKKMKNVLPQFDDDLFGQESDNSEIPSHIATEFEYFTIVEKDSRYNKKYKAWMMDYTIQLKEGFDPYNLKAAVAAMIEVAKLRTNFRENRDMINIIASNPELPHPISKGLKKTANPQNILDIV